MRIFARAVRFLFRGWNQFPSEVWRGIRTRSLYAVPLSVSAVTIFTAARSTDLRCCDRRQIFGAHVDGIQFDADSGSISKQLQDAGRGEREAKYLKLLSASPDWSRFVPEYRGRFTDARGCEWVSMENLTAGMKRPFVLDLKVGTRHWGPDASATKRSKEILKSETTSIGTIGLRVVGCKIPGERYLDHDSYYCGYKENADLGAEEIPSALLKFLRTDARRHTTQEFVKALLALFVRQDEYVFFGSSLLLAYDGALGDEAPLRISMIDFGHVHSMDEMLQEAALFDQPSFKPRDTGYIHGLLSLLDILNDVDKSSE